MGPPCSKLLIRKVMLRCCRLYQIKQITSVTGPSVTHADSLPEHLCSAVRKKRPTGKWRRLEDKIAFTLETFSSRKLNVIRTTRQIHSYTIYIAYSRYGSSK